MIKNLVITAFLAMTVPFQVSWAWAQQKAPEPAVAETAQTQMASELESRITTNKLFMKTAREAIRQAGTPKTKDLFKRAEAARLSGRNHFMAGELKPSIDDYSESSHLAIQVIIIVKNEQSKTMRESAIEAADIIRAGDDRKREEEMIIKGMAEVEIFLKTAERLQQEGESEKAALRLTEARTLYDRSKKGFSDGEYTNALEDVNNAYRAATDAVKIIKNERPEIITFPRSKSSDEKDVLASELRRNDAYRFFAAQLVSGNNTKKAAKHVRHGDSLRDEASDIMNGTDTGKAIGILKKSTDSYIMAIKLSLK